VTKQPALETKKNRTLLNSQEHLRMAAEAALIGTWEADPQTGVRHWSSQFRAILGRQVRLLTMAETTARTDLEQLRQASGTLAALQGRITAAQSTLAQLEQSRAAAQARLADAARLPFRRQVRVFDRDHQVRWLRMEGVPRLDDAGSFLGYTGCALDVTDSVTAEERQNLLINELNHRVKNTLATVQSIVFQTLRSAETPAQARMDVEARLIALSRAHDVLTRENWEGAALADIIKQTAEPYAGEGTRRFVVDGPPIRLDPRLSLAIAMVLQELATNAVKYGALSNAMGIVEITWTVSSANRLALTWREVGGPKIKPPKRRGFGTSLIERSLASDMSGRADLSFEPSGLVCRIEASLDPR
jgi:two-component sensor histidine kinase